VGLSVLGNDPGWVEQTLREAARFLASQGGFSVALEAFHLEAIDLDGLV